MGTPCYTADISTVGTERINVPLQLFIEYFYGVNSGAPTWSQGSVIVPWRPRTFAVAWVHLLILGTK